MNRNIRLALVPLLLLAVLSAAMTWYLASTAGGPPAPSLPSGPVTETLSRNDLPLPSADKPSQLVPAVAGLVVPAELPASLDGTSVPQGWARVDSAGNLIPTAQLRTLFEYYLSALGEETLPQLVARIRQALAVLVEPARQQAMEVLAGYLDYKLAVSDLEASYQGQGATGAAELARRMGEVQALRRSFLDDRTATAFFAADEAVDEFQVARLRIREDSNLTADEQAAAIARAEQALPAPLREARQATRRFADYERVKATLADDPEALRRYRETEFGEAAARRLEQAEAEREDWGRRWQAYSDERSRLQASGLAAPELAAGIERLRASYFHGAELARAEALDSIR